ncbi:cytochrome c [Linderina pennispora]|uniref:Cytochrome c n=1 Tax=Linderina pennispora TaxID=61395 RepID=A0A1Y1WII2_9FUNG|nr:cytochrome c [Linderina pennispora]ORX73175.1 cytochrome c [Linderina pennispora]
MPMSPPSPSSPPSPPHEQSGARSPAADGSEINMAKGARLFRTRCGLCHTVTPGCNKSGPSLWQGYAYTPAMKSSKVLWSEDTMAEFLRSPKRYIPGNKMVFQGFQRDSDIRDVVAYVKAESERKKLF